MTDETTVEEETPLAESEPAQDLETGVENEAEATEASPDGEEQQEQKPDAQDTSAGEGKSRAKKRIRQLSRKAQALERQNAQLMQRLSAIEERIPKQETPRPAKEDFETEEEYLDAYYDYKKAQDAQPEQRQDDNTVEVADEFIEQFEDALEEVAPDAVDIVMSPDFKTTPDMTDYIRVSDRGAEMAYHLAKNPKEVERIASLSPIVALRELEKIEANLPKKGTQSTNASTPPPPLSESKPGRSTQSIVDEDRLSDAEWNRLHRAGKLPSQLRQRTS